MPTRLNSNFPRLKDPDEFESLIRDICAAEWQDPDTTRFGRSGQKQYGVDVYGNPQRNSEIFRGAQCKLRPKGKQLTEAEVEKEVKGARSFPHNLDKLIIVTDTPRDTHLQVIIDKINQRETKSGGFRVAIWFWEDITERLAAYPMLIGKYYKEWVTSLTTQPFFEHLIGTPLRLLVDASGYIDDLSIFEESLHFRGVRTIKKQPLRQSVEYDHAHVDGIVCWYQSDGDEREEEIFSFVSNLKGHIRHNNNVPIFLILRSSESTFFDAAKKLQLNLESVTIIKDENLTLADISGKVFDTVFSHGYSKRGSFTSIELTARTIPSKVTSSLLDIDWSSRLGIDKFPSTAEWQNIFVPALENIRDQVISQGEKTRVHINSQLPIPAALALGFYLNIRNAQVGVWARNANSSEFKQQFWFSDSPPAQIDFQAQWIQDPLSHHRAAIVELSTYVPIHSQVKSFCAENLETDNCAWVSMSLEIDGKSPENIEDDQAIAFAKQVGQLLRYLNSKGITDIHLFCRIPSALAILIGQRLQACGNIHLYWFTNPTYRLGFTLS